MTLYTSILYSAANERPITIIAMRLMSINTPIALSNHLSTCVDYAVVKLPISVDIVSDPDPCVKWYQGLTSKGADLVLIPVLGANALADNEEAVRVKLLFEGEECGVVLSPVCSSVVRYKLIRLHKSSSTVNTCFTM